MNERQNYKVDPLPLPGRSLFYGLNTNLNSSRAVKIGSPIYFPPSWEHDNTGVLNPQIGSPGPVKDRITPRHPTSKG